MRIKIEDYSQLDRQPMILALCQYALDIGKMSEHMHINELSCKTTVSLIRNKKTDTVTIKIQNPNWALEHAFGISVLTASYFLNVHKENEIEPMLEKSYAIVQENEDGDKIMEMIGLMQLQFAKYVNKNKLTQEETAETSQPSCK